MIFAVFDPSPLTVCINCSFFYIYIQSVHIGIISKVRNSGVWLTLQKALQVVPAGGAENAGVETIQEKTAEVEIAGVEETGVDSSGGKYRS